MLFVALTQSRIADRLQAHSPRQFSIAPDCFLTWITDGFMSRLEVAENEITATESLLASCEDRRNDVIFFSARFLLQDRWLRISKSTSAGRPVYYTQDARGNFFVSTHIALLRQAGVTIEEDPQSLPELLIYRTVAPPRSFYRGIRRMKIAGELDVRWKSGRWTLSGEDSGYRPPPPGPQLSEAQAVDAVAGVLIDSVRALKPVSSQVTTLLSGGLDSSLLSAVARDQIGAHDTFSSSYPFDEPEVNFEQKYALSAAAALSTRHTLFTPHGSDFVAGVVDAVADAETPLHHLQSTLLHLLFRHAIPKNFNKVIIGEAADCAFGIDDHFMVRRALELPQRISSFGPVYGGLKMLGRRWKRVQARTQRIARMKNSRLPIAHPLNPLWDCGAYGDFAWVESNYGASREDIVAIRYRSLHAFEKQRFEDVLSLYLLNYSEVVGTTSIWSKLAEGQGKTAYYPFVRRELLDAAFSTAWETKLKSPKHILRQVAQKLGVPDFIRNRPKQSFGIVSNRWAEPGGTLEPLIALAAKVVDVKQLRSLQGADPRKAMTLWSLLNYALLKRLLVGGESRQTLRDELTENSPTNGVRQPAEPQPVNS